jgi:glutathione S-transferase
MTTPTQSRLTLVSHRLCPYVQRAAIALQESGIEYRRIDIDLEDPPAWFQRLSPLGKVPLLLIDDESVLFESAVIAEYINDIGAGNLLSVEPVTRAGQRAWIEFASATLDNIGVLYSAKDEQAFARAANQLDSKWRQLEQVLPGTGFFSGAEFSLVDAAFGPVFRYLDVFEALVDEGFLDDFARVSAWRRDLQQRESVINAVRHDYPTLLLEFLSQRDSWLGQRAKSLLANRFAA